MIININMIIINTSDRQGMLLIFFFFVFHIFLPLFCFVVVFVVILHKLWIPEKQDKWNYSFPEEGMTNQWPENKASIIKDYIYKRSKKDYKWGVIRTLPYTKQRKESRKGSLERSPIQINQKKRKYHNKTKKEKGVERTDEKEVWLLMIIFRMVLILCIGLFKYRGYCNINAFRFLCRMVSLTELNTMFMLRVSMAVVKWWYIRLCVVRRTAINICNMKFCTSSKECGLPLNWG